MRKLIQGALALTAGMALAAALVAAFGGSAQAAPTNDCKTAVEQLTNRPDTGTGGHVWALNTMKRTLRVCASDEVAPEGKRWYYATVTDTGTFVTNAGKTPRGVAGLPAGVTGTIEGGFEAHFTADANWVGWEPDELSNTTSTSGWVKTAFPSAEGTLIGSYVWTYKSPCETYKDNNDVYQGDITKACLPSPSPSTPTAKPTKPTPKPTLSPSQSPVGAQLPVTGDRGVPTIALYGFAAVGGGVALLIGLRLFRRREDRFQA